MITKSCDTDLLVCKQRVQYLAPSILSSQGLLPDYAKAQARHPEAKADPQIRGTVLKLPQEPNPSAHKTEGNTELSGSFLAPFSPGQEQLDLYQPI